MAFAFEKLVVYQKSVDFADEICRQTEQFPRGYGFLVDQLNRALRRQMLTENKHRELKLRLEEISRMLSGLIKGLENREL